MNYTWYINLTLFPALGPVLKKEKTDQLSQMCQNLKQSTNNNLISI